MSDNPRDLSDSASDNPPHLHAVSDNPPRFVASVGPRRPVVGHSPQSLLELIHAGVNGLADLDQTECRLIPSRSVDPERGTVPTLVLTFEGGETWYVEVERQRL